MVLQNSRGKTETRLNKYISEKINIKEKSYD
jgi:hypothetical protein